jgi:hypothetical protein
MLVQDDGVNSGWKYKFERYIPLARWVNNDGSSLSKNSQTSAIVIGIQGGWTPYIIIVGKSYVKLKSKV